MTAIIVPEVNIWTPPREWPRWMFERKKKYEEYLQKFMAGVTNNVGGAGGDLNTTVTPGRSNLFTWSYSTGSGVDSYIVVGDGYDGGVDFYTSGSIGSIGSATYTDGGGTSRTVTAIYYAPDLGLPAGPSPAADDLFLCITPASSPDTDNTFVDIQIQDNTGTLRTFTRASRTTYYASTGSCTTWRWNSVLNSPFFVVATGARTFNVRI